MPEPDENPQDNPLAALPDEPWLVLASGQAAQAHPMLGLLEPGVPIPVPLTENEATAARALVAMKVARFVAKPKPKDEPKAAPAAAPKGQKNEPAPAPTTPAEAPAGDGK